MSNSLPYLQNWSQYQYKYDCQGYTLERNLTYSALRVDLHTGFINQLHAQRVFTKDYFLPNDLVSVTPASMPGFKSLIFLDNQIQ